MSNPCLTIVPLSKNIGGKKLWRITAICHIFANFHYFPNIPYVNGLQFANVFPAKLPTVLLRQTFYCQSFLLYGINPKSVLAAIIIANQNNNSCTFVTQNLTHS